MFGSSELLWGGSYLKATAVSFPSFSSSNFLIVESAHYGSIMTNLMGSRGKQLKDLKSYVCIYRNQNSAKSYGCYMPRAFHTWLLFKLLQILHIYDEQICFKNEMPFNLLPNLSAILIFIWKSKLSGLEGQWSWTSNNHYDSDDKTFDSLILPLSTLMELGMSWKIFLFPFILVTPNPYYLAAFDRD